MQEGAILHILMSLPCLKIIVQNNWLCPGLPQSDHPKARDLFHLLTDIPHTVLPKIALYLLTVKNAALLLSFLNSPFGNSLYPTPRWLFSLCSPAFLDNDILGVVIVGVLHCNGRDCARHIYCSLSHSHGIYVTTVSLTECFSISGLIFAFWSFLSFHEHLLTILHWLVLNNRCVGGGEK